MITGGINNTANNINGECYLLKMNHYAEENTETD